MSNNKEDDILEAAMELFARRGYDGTTVPMIAEKAKVGAGTIYRYFENKEALVNSLFISSVTKFSETLKNQFPETDDIRAQFNHIFYRMFKFAQQNPFALHFINAHTGGYYLDQASKEVFNEFFSFLTAIIDEGKGQGTLRSLPSKALICLVYGAFINLFKMFESGDLEKSQELLKNIEEACWDAIRII
ncbi:TetR/AcrR family transcriptional regulator [Paenibacillus filicis]|uniref:TetR/AcrR family transcriptional regulator n=1 Tax=Paenibacillus gyeongsangnamensis TaxID=3388067 RepID=A0ABT4QHT9_9BACL|nr:TetR/AcrR family transcriptional regulator [Paenibacillus filicis]MCZ8516422.1 TetR/AcrR family transcriptional regulator [Paenibacillus filicis]